MKELNFMSLILESIFLGPSMIRYFALSFELELWRMSAQSRFLIGIYSPRSHRLSG